MHSFADLISVEVPNPELRDMSRVQCKYFGTCAGCQYQVRLPPNVFSSAVLPWARRCCHTRRNLISNATSSSRLTRTTRVCLPFSFLLAWLYSWRREEIYQSRLSPPYNRRSPPPFNMAIALKSHHISTLRRKRCRRKAPPLARRGNRLG